MDRRSFLSSLALAPLGTAAAKPFDFLDVSRRPSGRPANNSASMWIYLWDIVDEGYDQVLMKLRDCDLTSLSLATAYHGGRFLEPHNPKRKVIFLEDGTVYFMPNPKLYRRIQPRVNSLVKSGHDLQKVKQLADKVGLKTRSWVVCCHNTPLGMRYPDIACEDAFGDKLYHNLCPSNEDVRTYLRGLVSDIALRDVDAIELEALQFQGYTHGYLHEREGIELNSAARFLLGLCFCPACCARARTARFDLQRVRSFTREALEQFFVDPATAAEKYPAIDQLPAELFEPLLEWRKSVVSSLVEELAEVAKSCPVRQMVSVDSVARKLVSVDPAASAKATGGVLVLGYVRDGPSLREPLQALRSSIGQADITVGVQVGLPGSGGKQDFLAKVAVARELGIRSFNFYNYGFIPYQNLTWVKQALRE